MCNLVLGAMPCGVTGPLFYSLLQGGCQYPGSIEHPPFVDVWEQYADTLSKMGSALWGGDAGYRALYGGRWMLGTHLG